MPKPKPDDQVIMRRLGIIAFSTIFIYCAFQDYPKLQASIRDNGFPSATDDAVSFTPISVFFLNIVFKALLITVCAVVALCLVQFCCSALLRNNMAPSRMKDEVKGAHDALGLDKYAFKELVDEGYALKSARSTRWPEIDTKHHVAYYWWPVHNLLWIAAAVVACAAINAMAASALSAIKRSEEQGASVRRPRRMQLDRASNDIVLNSLFVFNILVFLGIIVAFTW